MKRERAERRRLIAMWLLIPTAFVVWLQYLAPLSLGGPVSLTWVTGDSMEPGLSTGDLSVMYRRSRYEEGDVVAFEIPEGGVVIHRVETVRDARYTFIGDNRPHTDPWTLGPEAIRGRQVFSIPKVAFVMSAMRDPKVMGVLAAVLAGLVMWKRDLDNEDHR